MKIDRIPDIRPDSPGTPVTLKKVGNIFEVRYMKITHGSPIQKLDKDHGVDLRTGELIEFKHNLNRSEDTASVAQSLKRLRDLINANLTDPRKALWVTLTYEENMTDPKRLYQDYRRFWQRLSYYLEKRGLPSAEYIIAAEPQGRGAWHLHCLFLFPCKAPFIPNSDIERMWKNQKKDHGKGFTKTKGLTGIDNPGLYLTAYLGDMELNEAIAAGNAKGHISQKDTEDEHGNHQKKAIVKGARMHLYPSGFNLYRCSRGIKKPISYSITEGEAMAIIGDAPLTYEKTFGIINEEGEHTNFINFRQYNISRRVNKYGSGNFFGEAAPSAEG